MLAALTSDDLGYRLLLLGHLLFVIVGFGSTFVWPALGREAGKRGGAAAAVLSEVSVSNARWLTIWPIWAAGAFGLALAIASERMDESWATIAVTLFLASMAFSHFVHLPNINRMDTLIQQLAAGGPPPAGASGPPPQVIEIQTRGKAAARNGGILHLAFLVLLVLMIWQPGR